VEKLIGIILGVAVGLGGLIGLFWFFVLSKAQVRKKWAKLAEQLGLSYYKGGLRDKFVVTVSGRYRNHDVNLCAYSKEGGVSRSTDYW